MTRIQKRERDASARLAQAGMILKKTPSRSSLRRQYGVGYMIVTERNVQVTGGTPVPYWDTLDDIEAFVAENL